MTGGGIVKFAKFCCAAFGDAGRPTKSSKSSLPDLGIGVGGGFVLNLDLGMLSGIGAGAGAGTGAVDVVAGVGGTTFRGTVRCGAAAAGGVGGTMFCGIGLCRAAVAGCGGGTGFCGIGLNTDGL